MSTPPCQYCKDSYEKVGGSDVSLVWHCSRCGTTASAEPVHDVYDAAMALLEAEDEVEAYVHREAAYFGHEQARRNVQNKIDAAKDSLLDACRRAKEGR